MAELATNEGGKPLSIAEVARRQSISAKYLEQVFSVLKTAGLVRSIRGAEGGYALVAPPAKTTVLQIVTALEGPLSPVECVGNARLCRRAEQCPTRDVWRRVGEAMNEALRSVTLADLASQAPKRRLPANYSI